jgi:Na+-translocating ferredoxin:NAD+ oxidoreductase RnfA subunit
MIQRIQSIFLLLSGLSFLALFKVPFAMSTEPIPNLLSDLFYNVQDSPILMALAGVGGLVTIGAIFLYNNRGLQLKMTNLSIIASILLVVVAVLLMYNERTLTTKASLIEDQLGIYLPIISLALSIFAGRYIRKDENIVQSMDRLR